jgi:hypothetical protein
MSVIPGKEPMHWALAQELSPPAFSAGKDSFITSQYAQAGGKDRTRISLVDSEMEPRRLRYPARLPTLILVIYDVYSSIRFLNFAIGVG